MKWNKADIARWTVSVLLIIAAITIASLTIGRDIYYGAGDHGLLSFGIVNFSGYLFFLFMPVEIAFIYYLSGNVNVWVLNALAICTALLAQSIDYLIGFLLSEKIIDRFIGKRRYEKAESKIRKYGNIAIFVFNALPLSSPVITLAAGMLKHRIKDAVIYTVAGLLFKYLMFTLIFR
ncbi:MAG TPA: VTT domain-containing protein [Bacteroidales bacterium]|nr:VTT domain-containing protein [Bacteroidales bacterium]